MLLPGVYLHWPFCERKCPYCDFYTFGREHPHHARQADFLEALLVEIETLPERLGLAGPVAIDTLYFGGGTPSLMGPAAAERLLEALHCVFAVQPGAEVTMEINPTTAEAADLPALLGLGINRLSVGAQSFNDRLLRQLGRVHDAATTRRALDLMRRAGCRNLSLDLIFGVPGQSDEDFAADLAEVLAFAPEHFSAYNLTLHPGTPYAQWERTGRLVLPEEDLQVAMFERLMDTLAAAGYEHYEISNWARPGLAARHNSKYWHRADVYPLGPAAHGVLGSQSALGARRIANPPDLPTYLDPARRELCVPQEPPATPRACAGEIMMLALRRVAGPGWAELNEWLGADARAFYAPEFARLAADGLLQCDATGPRLTRAGLLLADTVMEAFF
jgi:oxygen-independent coproporphyrinogen-3 oxidase